MDNNVAYCYRMDNSYFYDVVNSLRVSTKLGSWKVIDESNDGFSVFINGYKSSSNLGYPYICRIGSRYIISAERDDLLKVLVSFLESACSKEVIGAYIGVEDNKVVLTYEHEAKSTMQTKDLMVNILAICACMILVVGLGIFFNILTNDGISLEEGMQRLGCTLVLTLALFFSIMEGMFYVNKR